MVPSEPTTLGKVQGDLLIQFTSLTGQKLIIDYYIPFVVYIYSETEYVRVFLMAVFFET